LRYTPDLLITEQITSVRYQLAWGAGGRRFISSHPDFKKLSACWYKWFFCL